MIGTVPGVSKGVAVDLLEFRGGGRRRRERVRRREITCQLFGLGPGTLWL
jgi:hypothetical protein